MIPWKTPLDAAIAANSARPESRYLQLATIAIGGGPSVRTMVFRRFFDHQTDRCFVFCSDLRSEKVVESRANPLAQACWYFPETRQQFRITGRLELVDSRTADPEKIDLRNAVWRSLSDESRVTFSWPPPGEKLADLALFSVEVPNAFEPLDNFVLFIHRPMEVEMLDLRMKPHRRLLSARTEAGWGLHPINP